MAATPRASRAGRALAALMIAVILIAVIAVIVAQSGGQTTVKLNPVALHSVQQDVSALDQLVSNNTQ